MTPYKIIEKELWTAHQKKTDPLHRISYRASFKSQLPEFFIKKYTKKGDVVYDPFAGRGTTAIQSLLMDRNAIANDINPLIETFVKSRINPPTYDEVEERLKNIEYFSFSKKDHDKENLNMFYHKKTLDEILSLKNYFLNKKLDRIDYFIKMVAISRLSGHSKGFFSVYTLPPNQAVQRNRQVKINEKRNQVPEYKDTKLLILKKTKALLKEGAKHLNKRNLNLEDVLVYNFLAEKNKKIKENTVQLVVTSPPFLDVVDYAGDNWIRNWFDDSEEKKVNMISIYKNIEKWEHFTYEVLKNLKVSLKKDGYIAYEVGEVRGGEVDLSKNVIQAGIKAGLKVECLYINKQKFTKTSAVWGIKNNKKGTNTNRIVVFKK